MSSNSAQFSNIESKEVLNESDRKTDLELSYLKRIMLNDDKAGMQGLDKERINKIIYEASKGSKFYENELRKERKIKEKIEQMHLELSKFSENEKKNAFMKSNLIYEKLSKQVDLTRILVHIDMDAFYAAVEMRDCPELQNVPMAVGCSAMLSTSNYLARRFGVRAAMPGFIAKKLCPQLIIVPPHFEKYQKVSMEVQEIFQEYDPNFLRLSLDEAYLDLTEYIKDTIKTVANEVQTKDLVEVVVEEIRNKIFEKTKLTSSAGIAPNMMLSKICSDINKPNGQFYLKPDYAIISTFIKNLPIRKVFGIGNVSEQLLKSIGVLTCNDLYEKRNILYLLFSEGTFIHFMQTALGVSSNHLEHSMRKSMSVERTFQDISNKEELLKICQTMAENLANDLFRENLCGRTISLKYKLSSFITKTRAKTVSGLVSGAEELFLVAKELLLNEMQAYKEGEFILRLIGIRISQLNNQKNSKQKTVDCFFNTNDIFNKKFMQECPICGSWFKSSRIQTHVTKCLSKSNELEKTLSKPEFKNQKSESKTLIPHELKTGKTILNPDVCSNDAESAIISKACSSSYTVTCPVCGCAIRSNINSHIDSCLNKEAVKVLVRDSMNQEVSKSSKKRKSLNNDIVVQPEKKTLYIYIYIYTYTCILYSFFNVKCFNIVM